MIVTTVIPVTWSQGNVNQMNAYQLNNQAHSQTFTGVLPPVTILVLPKILQNYRYESHDRLYKAELEGCLLAETKEPNGVRLPCQAACAIHA